MDVRPAHAYVGRVMNLLLLLSALLSALTGVSGNARVATPQAVSQRVDAVAQAATAAARIAARPVQPLATLDMVADAPLALADVVAPSVADRLTNRRRE